MSWGLGDLANWVNGLRDTFKGGNPNAVGNSSIQAGIVNPLKVASNFTGVTQGYKGAKPNASVKDQGLALLALAGMLGGQEAAIGLKSAMTPEYAYGLHVRPKDVQGIKKIKLTNDVVSRYGENATPGMNAFFGFGKTPQSIPERAFESTMRWGDYQQNGGTIDLIRTPLKHILEDTRSSVGWKTPKNLKILKSLPFDATEENPWLWDMFSPEDNIVFKDDIRKLIGKKK